MEVARQPTQEVKYLGLRQRLKDSIRQKSKQSTAGISSQEKEKRLPYNNFGSFFGPSQPVVSQRVIQESKSLLENQDLVSKMLSANQSAKKNSASPSTGSKLGPKATSELKKKVEKLKVARDYSFLSDDAEVLVPAKESPPRNISVPTSEVRLAQMLPKIKQPFGSNSNSSTNVQGTKQLGVEPSSKSNFQRPKKKQLAEFEEARMIIRKMFHSDRYPVCDDDDDISEANFEDCMREERRSAKIGRKEDERELKLIEEENRRERMRRLAKRCKLTS